ncbi:SMI1/KNR4 family protein [Achromobacter pestifer]
MIESLRERYSKIAGIRPASDFLLQEIEKSLNLTLPTAFREICEFFDGGGLNVIPLFSLAANASVLNPLIETERLRVEIGFPEIYLVLAEPAESLIVMECVGSGRVLWLDALDVGQLKSEQFSRPPDTWPSFVEFFSYLLDEEEEDLDL